MTIEWETFIASLDPQTVIRERMRTPTRGERPGSKTDQQMRTQHEMRARQFRRQMADRDGRLRRFLADAEARDYSPHQFDIEDIQLAKALMGRTGTTA